jgi:hypothetical protein
VRKITNRKTTKEIDFLNIKKPYTVEIILIYPSR